MIEREKTYLVKYIPFDLLDYSFEKIKDIYIPGKHQTAQIRFRKKNNYYEFTKKCPINIINRSLQKEESITLDREEFEYIDRFLSNKINKHRYLYSYDGLLFHIDIFQEDLSGLIMADIEFPDEESKKNFQMPEFCLCEVTQDVTFAGGLLCGKSYEDISEKLDTLGYKKLSMN